MLYRTAVYNCNKHFGSEGRSMLLLSVVVHYQVLLCLDPYDTNTIATNTLCKLNFMYFSMYLVISQQHNYQGFL